ncbi:MAG: insulinase family protein, partial [Maioricimonas sp. JB049]
MPEQNILAEQLTNGLTLIMEPMSEVRSAAFSLLVPAGAIYEPSGFNGTASILTDLITRGAGARNSRELSSALDNLGIQRSESVGWNFATFSAASVAENIIPALEIY